MALTVRPDDEVYQFDTVWLGPDEYTLPIQARYVAWGTWLVCFLVAVVILVPLGGGGPGGVLGSLIWSFAVSVVLSRAVMLVVDHERPLRSLPALFSAEARAALAARRRSERSLLLRATKVSVRDTPEKVLEMRRRDHERADRKAAKRRPEPRYVPEEELGPDWRTGPVRPEWMPDLPPDDWAEPVLAWTVPSDHVPSDHVPSDHVPRDHVPGDDPAERSPARVPVPAAAVVRAAAGEAAAGEQQHPGRHERPDGNRSDRPRSGPFRDHPSAPLTVSPTRGRHAARDEAEQQQDQQHQHPRDRQAAVEARILLPVRKDR